MSRHFKIEDDVPIPSVRVYPQKYPFPEMEPGQSFFMEGGDAFPKLREASRKFTGNHPEFNFKVMPEKNGARCWRLPIPTLKPRPLLIDRTMHALARGPKGRKRS